MADKKYYLHPIRIYRLAELCGCHKAEDLKAIPIVELPPMYIIYTNVEEFIKTLKERFTNKIEVNERQIKKLVGRVKKLRKNLANKEDLNEEHLIKFLTGESGELLGHKFLPVNEDVGAFVIETGKAIHAYIHGIIDKDDLQRGRYYFTSLSDF